MKETIETLIQVAKESGAAQTVLEGKRADGFTVALVVRKEGALLYGEFSEEQIRTIRNIIAQKLWELFLDKPKLDESDRHIAQSKLDMINVCQEKLDLPIFETWEEYCKKPFGRWNETKFSPKKCQSQF